MDQSKLLLDCSKILCLDQVYRCNSFKDGITLYIPFDNLFCQMSIILVANLVYVDEGVLRLLIEALN